MRDIERSSERAISGCLTACRLSGATVGRVRLQPVKCRPLDGRLQPMTREALLQEALRLPRRERADVAAELLASLDDELTDDPQELEKAWAAEIEVRARRVLAGESPGSPWEDVEQRIRTRLAK